MVHQYDFSCQLPRQLPREIVLECIQPIFETRVNVGPPRCVGENNRLPTQIQHVCLMSRESGSNGLPLRERRMMNGSNQETSTNTG